MSTSKINMLTCKIRCWQWYYACQHDTMLVNKPCSCWNANYACWQALSCTHSMLYVNTSGACQQTGTACWQECAPVNIQCCLDRGVDLWTSISCMLTRLSCIWMVQAIRPVDRVGSCWQDFHPCWPCLQASRGCQQANYYSYYYFITAGMVVERKPCVRGKMSENARRRSKATSCMV